MPARRTGRSGKAAIGDAAGGVLPAVIAMLVVSSGAVPARAAGFGPTWEGSATLDAFHVSDLFPGGTRREADDGLRLDTRPEVQWRLPSHLRVKPWARLLAERYRTWNDRDLERWSGGVDVRRGAHRLRVYGGWTSRELYFPSSLGGAWLDRRDAGAELRVGFAPGWLAEVTADREHDDFLAPYDERDGTRWTFHSGLERTFGEGRTTALTWIYRRNDSITDLYTYDHNALRGSVGWRLAAWNGRLEAEAALRNYRTPELFDANSARQDGRWRVRTELGRAVAPHLSAGLYGEYRRNRSTRFVKDYDATAAGVSLELAR